MNPKLLSAVEAEIFRLENNHSRCRDMAVRLQYERQIVRLRMAACLLSGDPVEFRPLVRLVVEGRQEAVASSIPIRRQTISEYLGYKAAISADSLEAILNYAL